MFILNSSFRKSAFHGPYLNIHLVLRRPEGQTTKLQKINKFISKYRLIEDITRHGARLFYTDCLHKEKKNVKKREMTSSISSVDMTVMTISVIKLESFEAYLMK